jgi:DNA-binding transcriptional MerR regulator
MHISPSTITELISPEGEWLIEELLSEWRRFEARLPQPVDARVNAHLDARGVRYYQTLNLLPKPRRYQGRRAVYGAEHLLRLVCIRGLQAQGRSLMAVEQALERVEEPRLWALAAEVLGVAGVAGTPQAREPQEREPQEREPQEREPQAPPASHSRALISYTLTPGVTLMVDPALVSSPDDLVSAIAARISRYEDGEGD